MPELLPDTTISHYRIVSRIGAGGMGEVYLAQDTKLDRKVALKILPTQFAEDKDRMSRFVREAKSASALNHPNIITIHEIGESEGTHYIATEFIDGKTLNEYARTNSLDLKSALEIAVQIASALDEAHSAGIVHRDIKPDNVMLRANGLVKILDFGIAKLSAVNHQSGLSDEVATAIKSGTSPGMIIGTARYMSPEQAKGLEVDARTDIFSLGVVLYEMIADGLPFEGETAIEMIGSILRDEPKPMKSDVPAELKSIIGKCLRKDRDQRYLSIREVFGDLKELKQNLEFQDQLERSAAPHRGEPGTLIVSSRPTAETSQQFPPQQSIVVLPFANIGADGEDEYFSDGLTEELIADLSKVRSLKVISRSSAMKLKGTDKDLRTIVRELDVRFVLDGSVRKAGTSLRISAQLIDGISDANLWSEKYSGTLEDVFQMQESVSRSIVDALQITLSRDEQRQMEERPIPDARAYDLYLRSRSQLQLGIPAALDRSIELLKQGLDIIGDNELLYAALGYNYYFYFRWISKVDDNYLRLAHDCMQKAFAINPSSSHGFSLKGLLSYSEGNLADSFASLKRAVELEPTNTEALLWLSATSAYIGNYQASSQYADELRELDPLLPINTVIKAVVYIYKGEFGEGLAWIEKALAMDTSSPILIWSGVIAAAWDGKTNEAIAHIDDLAQIAPNWVYTQHALFLKHALRGEKSLALKYDTPELAKESQHDCHFALHVAHCFALIGEKKKALDFLGLAVRTGMVNYSFLGTFDPLLENIRHEPRFKELMQEARRLFAQINGLEQSPDSQPKIERTATSNREEARTLLEPRTTSNQAGEQKVHPRWGSSDLISHGRSRTKYFVIAVGILLISVIGFFGYRYFASQGRQIESIAVMPFVNESGNADVEYLSDGMTETLISSLSNLPNLSVKPRSSVFRYKGKETNPQTIARELNVQAILNGRVVQRGNEITLYIELIDAQKDTVLWKGDYNRQMSNLVTLQSEIARDVSGKLKSKLSGADIAAVEKVYTNNPEAYRLYLKGVYHAAKFNKEELEIGFGYLRQAVALDPNYALAYHGLAYYHYLIVDWTMSPHEAMPKAKEEALKAIELDDKLAVAHADLGAVYWYYDWNWPAAEKEFKRAIELDPDDSLSHEMYGWYLVTMGRVDEGIAQLKQGQELDPLAQERTSVLGWNLYLAHRYDESIEQHRKAIELEPDYWPGYSWLGNALAQKGRWPEATEAFQKARSIEPVIAVPTIGLGRVYAVSGKKDEAIKVLAELNDRSKYPYVSSYLIASIYAGLGDKDKAFASLERAYEDRSWYMSQLKLDPELDSLHSDPRFADLVKRVGLQ